MNEILRQYLEENLDPKYRLNTHGFLGDYYTTIITKKKEDGWDVEFPIDEDAISQAITNPDFNINEYIDSLIKEQHYD